MRCCDNPNHQEKLVSEPYPEGGLPDIYVVKINGLCLNCGEDWSTYPVMGRMHDYLCLALSQAPELPPHHFRFIRKSMGYSIGRIAKMIGVRPEDVRGVEIGSAPVPPAWHQLVKGLVQSGNRNEDLSDFPD